MKKPEKLSESLMHAAANDQSADVLLDLSETVLDDVTGSVIENEAVTKIPFLGAFVAVAKGFVSFRDRRYVSKILSFMSETSKATEQDRQKYLAKLEANPKESNKAGETILDIIDKLTSQEKAIMIGKVFRAYMREDEMTVTQLIYLCEIIERTYLQDLVSIQKSEIHNDVNLESVGIKKPLRTEDVNNAVEAAMARLMKKMPIVHETTIDADKEPVIQESGLTDAGYHLQRILRSYK